MKCKTLIINMLIISMIFSLVCCKNKKQTAATQTTPPTEMKSHAIPPVIIYKTVKDYSNFVPVTMNDDKTKIVSYPSTKDIRESGKPTPLLNDFWLDNRGISKNVAFLKYTYEEYAKLPYTPKVDELLKSIINKNPLLEIYNCGKRSDYKDLEKELNQKIKEVDGNVYKLFTPIK